MVSAPAPRDLEFELLLACARVHLEEAQQKRIADLLGQSLDWPRVYALADKHGLRALLFRHLGEGRLGRIPPGIEAKLWRYSEQLRRRNHEMETELLTLLVLLREAGIPALAHKGPVVARRAYRDADLREYGDLDLLMPLADIPRARTLLAARDYELKFPMAPAAEAALLAAPAQYHLMLVRGAGGMLVELHWKSDGDYVVERSHCAQWWQEAPAVEVLGGSVHCLPMEEFVLALCLHGSKHYWGSLHWLVDVAELLRVATPQTWAGYLQRAQELGATRRLAVTLLLVRDHLDVSLPAEISVWIPTVPASAGLASEMAGEWPTLDVSPHSAAGRLRLDLSLCDRPAQRLRHLRRSLFEPGVGEWSRWPLPRALHFLYVPLRVFRVVGRRLGLA